MTQFCIYIQLYFLWQNLPWFFRISLVWKQKDSTDSRSWIHVILTCEFFAQSCKWFLPPRLPFANNWKVFPQKWQQHLFSHYNYLSANFLSQPSRFVVFKLPDTWRWQQQRTRNSVSFVPQSWNAYRPRNGCSPWRIQSDESNKTLVATRGNT